MRNKFIKTAILTIGLILSLGLNVAHADVNDSTSGDELTDATFNVGDTLKLDNGDQKLSYLKQGKDQPYPPIIAFIIKTLNYATAIIGTLAMILLIIGGFRFMLAVGNQTKIDEAKDMIKFVIMGLIFTFLSYTITIFLQSIFIPETQ